MKTSKKRKPWDYTNSINSKNYLEDLSGFNPFYTAMNYSAGNRVQCYVANTLNKLGQHKIPKRAIYDFYYYSIPQNKKWLKYPKKLSELKEIKYLQSWFGCDEKAAKTALELIDKDELQKIKDNFEKRGFIK